MRLNIFGTAINYWTVVRILSRQGRQGI
jgi:hypothetical protein